MLVLATLVVTAISLLTNRMPPQWDMKYYLNIATDGLIGNKGLVAPFAYRPAAPLLVGAIAHLFKTDPESTFRMCAHVMGVVFILSCFYFATSTGATKRTAGLSAVTLALYFNIVKWPLFAGEMVDIYAYPLILIAFWALLQRRFYLCLSVSGVGLFFKEFMLLPLLTQAAVVAIKKRRRGWLLLAGPLGLTALVLVVCFIVPRLTIHVVQTFQDIDPINDPSTLRRLYLYPASRRRDFNIIFSYLACWLPILLLINRNRLILVWKRLQPYRLICALYLGFHFLLVMYGGTNLAIFVTYSLPVQILVLAVILDKGHVRLWEKIAMVTIVILFNRIWMQIPSPEQHLDAYLEFYGGYHQLVTPRSFFRMTEVLSWILGFWAVRALAARMSRSDWSTRAVETDPVQY